MPVGLYTTYELHIGISVALTSRLNLNVCIQSDYWIYVRNALKLQCELSRSLQNKHFSDKRNDNERTQDTRRLYCLNKINA
jgi:hypothetical protein